jgi:hypothetical protein
MSSRARNLVGTALEGVYRLPGRLVVTSDRLRDRRAAGHASPAPSAAPPVAPTGALVTVAHWRASPAPIGPVDAAGGDPMTRLRHLLECLRSALELDVSQVLVAVTSNQPEALLDDLAANLDRLPDGTEVRGLVGSDQLLTPGGTGRSVLVTEWRPRGIAHRHPFHLTWAHKPLIEAALGDPGFSHFVYLEDDLKFTQACLSYWCRYRQALARHGLLPGFVRVEALNGVLYVIDQPRSVSCTNLPSIDLGESTPDPGDGRLRFVNLPNSYQGMYVLDRPLAFDHFRRSQARNPLRSRGISHWGIRERAALGPILDDVPQGFLARNVVPVRTVGTDSCRLDESCLIEHLAGNYTRTRNEFGNIAVAELFSTRHA